MNKVLELDAKILQTANELELLKAQREQALKNIIVINPKIIQPGEQDGPDFLGI